jgi:hypothetical protein
MTELYHAQCSNAAAEHVNQGPYRLAHGLFNF